MYAKAPKIYIENKTNQAIVIIEENWSKPQYS